VNPSVITVLFPLYCDLDDGRCDRDPVGSATVALLDAAIEERDFGAVGRYLDELHELDRVRRAALWSARSQ
jgi:hypothetical protein